METTLTEEDNLRDRPAAMYDKELIRRFGRAARWLPPGNRCEQQR